MLTIISGHEYNRPNARRYLDNFNNIIAAGCVLHELLTLAPAFKARSLGSLLHKIKTGRYARVYPEGYSSDIIGRLTKG